MAPLLSRLEGAARIMGPAFLVSVAYLDPGNWATAIEAGSRHGYQLVWVVVLSNVIAILLQTLAARLGLVTGKHLAQVCREAYPPVVCYLLWLLCEISIVALDLTMVLGTAIGCNLLFGWPMLPCILLTGLDALLLLLLVPRQGVRTSEQLTVALLLVVVGCFVVDLFVSAPPAAAVLGGLLPRLQRDSVYTAVCLLGANVMPHNFYLHSALVSGQARGRAGTSLQRLCWYNFVDIAVALGIALVVNVAVLLVAAATFHQAGIVVHTLQDAHDLMEQILSSSVAPAAFGMALLCAGQLSTFTGTIAGQVVLRGFLNVHVSTWVRRVATRTAAILPAAVLQYVAGDKGTYKFLLIAQVILALQLPFTLVPLIKATSSAALMGPFKSSALLAGAAWAASGLVFVANLLMFISLLLPGAAYIPEVTPGEDSALHQYLDNLAALAWQQPLHFLLVIGLMVAAAALLALQLWVLITPLRQSGSTPPLLLVQHEKPGKQQLAALDTTREAWGPLGVDQPREGLAQWGPGGGGVAAVVAGSAEVLHHRHPVPAGPPAGAAPGAAAAVVATLPGWLPQGLASAVQMVGMGSSSASGGIQLPGAAASLLRHWRTPVYRPLGAPDSDSEEDEAVTMRQLPWQEQQQQQQQQGQGHDMHPQQHTGDSGAIGSRHPSDLSSSSSSMVRDSWEDLEGEEGMVLLPPSPTAMTTAPGHPQEQEQQQEGGAAGAGWDLVDDKERWLEPLGPSACHPGSDTAGPVAAARRLHHSTSGGGSSSSARSGWASQDGSWASIPGSTTAATAAVGAQQGAPWTPSSPFPPLRGRVVADSSSTEMSPGRLSPKMSSGGLSPSASSSGSLGQGALPLSRGSRKALAGLMDAFWQQHYDLHGAAVSHKAPSSHQQRSPRHAHQQQQQEQQLSIGAAGLFCSHVTWPMPAGSHQNQQQRPHQPGLPCCLVCSQQQVQQVVMALQQLQELVGGPQQLQQLLSDPLGDLGGSAGTGASSSSSVAPCLQPTVLVLQASAAGDWQTASAAAAVGVQHLQPPGTNLASSPSPAAPAVAHTQQALGPVLLLSWGLFCLALLLQWCQAEPRPELWGKYAYALNRLQGLLKDAGLEGQQQQQQQRRGASWWPWSTQLQRDMQQLLLGHLQDLEWALEGRRAPPDSGAAPAFAQGKQILASIVKRYKRRLAPSAAAGRGGGGDAGGGSGWRQQLVVLSAPLMVTSALLACVAWGWPQGTQLSLW